MTTDDKRLLRLFLDVRRSPHLHIGRSKYTHPLNDMVLAGVSLFVVDYLPGSSERIDIELGTGAEVLIRDTRQTPPESREQLVKNVTNSLREYAVYSMPPGIHTSPFVARMLSTTFRAAVFTTDSESTFRDGTERTNTANATKSIIELSYAPDTSLIGEEHFDLARLEDSLRKACSTHPHLCMSDECSGRYFSLSGAPS